MSSESPKNQAAEKPVPGGDNVLVEFENKIAWVTLNRPAKRNAMSPALNREMIQVVDALEIDERCGVLVLTGAGEAFSAGMDIKEYFRETDGIDYIAQARIQRDAEDWQWRKLTYFAKPTIAMVNGWCMGGAFAPLVACDLAIAAEDAKFGLSEVNWGIIPAGNISKAVADTMSDRDALYYIMTGETFTGAEAARMGLVNKAVPRDKLREVTKALAETLLRKNPAVLMTAKVAYKYCRGMDWDTSADYLHAKAEQLKIRDPEGGREKAMKQFLDDKSYRPGLKEYNRG